MRSGTGVCLRCDLGLGKVEVLVKFSRLAFEASGRESRSLLSTGIELALILWRNSASLA